jgi:hypothetical protein
MRRFYPGVITAHDDHFNLTFPDLPDAPITETTTLVECLLKAEHNLADYLESRPSRSPLPPPSSLQRLRNTVGALAGLVTVVMIPPLRRGRKARITIAIDQGLLVSLDAAAGPLGRSRWLAEAAEDKLAQTQAAEGGGNG